MSKAKELLLSSKGRFLGVTFLKKDGTIRNLTGRFNVRKHLHGGVSKNTNTDQMIIYDIINKGYRTITLSSVLEIKVNGKLYSRDEIGN